MADPTVPGSIVDGRFSVVRVVAVTVFRAFADATDNVTRQNDRWTTSTDRFDKVYLERRR